MTILHVVFMACYVTVRHFAISSEIRTASAAGKSAWKYTRWAVIYKRQSTADVSCWPCHRCTLYNLIAESSDGRTTGSQRPVQVCQDSSIYHTCRPLPLPLPSGVRITLCSAEAKYKIIMGKCRYSSSEAAEDTEKIMTAWLISCHNVKERSEVKYNMQ